MLSASGMTCWWEWEWIRTVKLNWAERWSWISFESKQSSLCKIRLLLCTVQDNPRTFLWVELIWRERCWELQLHDWIESQLIMCNLCNSSLFFDLMSKSCSSRCATVIIVACIIVPACQIVTILSQIGFSQTYLHLFFPWFVTFALRHQFSYGFPALLWCLSSSLLLSISRI